MKVIKYILIGIGLIFLAGFAPAMGSCVFIGLLVMGVLDWTGVIDKIYLGDNAMLIIAGIFGVFIFSYIS